MKLLTLEKLRQARQNEYVSSLFYARLHKVEKYLVIKNKINYLNKSREYLYKAKIWIYDNLDWLNNIEWKQDGTPYKKYKKQLPYYLEIFYNFPDIYDFIVKIDGLRCPGSFYTISNPQKPQPPQPLTYHQYIKDRNQHKKIQADKERLKLQCQRLEEKYRDKLGDCMLTHPVL